MDDGMARASALRESDLLRDLPEEVVQDFLDRVTLTRFPPKSLIFREAERADRMFMIVTGRVKVTRKGERGRENILVIAGPGELLGGLPIFEPSVHRTTASAVDTSEVAWLGGDGMRGWLEQHTPAAIRFMRLLIRRTQYQNDFLHDVFGFDVGTRVARAILREAHRFGRQTSAGLRVNLGLNQEELAMHVRASRESVNQALATFARMGWIRRDGVELVILDESQLAHHAGNDE